MYLKSIEVQGFKSFANKIKFEFHNGITGIVGPNGSGKSNVADAVRWVLGEQRIKQLRGGRMEDVIFAGTENRKPLGYAHVAITLDNTDHKLSVEYSEVTVSRRLFRSGESEYRINGAVCRLKDIHELFYDTGIGKEGYSIIGQGQIDKILSGKPEERRELFDEAAGIVKFKRRKAETIKKLENEKQNLVRVTDILSELEKQVKPLERQSEKAREYLKLREQLKICEIHQFLLEVGEINKQLEEIKKNTDITQSELETGNQKMQEIRKTYEKLETYIEQINHMLDEKKNELSQLKLNREKFEGEIRVLSEQIHSFQINETHNKNRIQALEQELLEHQRKKEEMFSQKEELELSKNQALQNQAEADRMRQTVEQHIKELTEQIEELKEDIIRLLNEKSNVKAKIQRYDTMLEQINIKKAEINQRMLKYQSDADAQEKIISKLQEELETIQKEIQANEEQKKSLEGSLKHLNEEVSENKKNYNESMSLFHRQNSSLEALKNLTERYEGYGNSIKRIMELKEKEKGIIGVVADIIKTEKKYETAIETALGGNIQNVVTDTEATAKRAIEHLKKNKYGRATFLPLNSIANRTGFQNDRVFSEKGVIGLACDLITIQKEYENIGKYLLGRIVVADTIDNALALAKKFQYSLRIVTLEGELLNVGGSLSGGAFKNSSNLLGRRREIEELSQSVDNLKQQSGDLSAKISSQEEQITEKRAELSRVNTVLNEQSLLQNTIKMNLDKADEKKRELAGSYEDFTHESSELREQMTDIKNNHATLNEELDHWESKNTQIEAEILRLNTELAKEREKEALELKSNEELRLKASGITQQIGFLEENLERMAAESEKLNREKQELIQAQTESEKASIEKKAEIASIRQLIETEEKKSRELEAEILKMTQEKENQSKEHKEFFAKREELSAHITALDRELYRLNASNEKLEENKEKQMNYMWEEYEVTYGSAKELQKEEKYQSLSAVKKETAAVKQDIRNLGSVNVNAIEEYKEVSERYSFLKTQHDDLTTAAQNLEDIIQELDIGMRNQFQEKFADIRREFDKVFKILFGGGKGSIELSEAEDILEAEISIISQPPGKKLQNMMQLSGGEKALTAISLLFAIQNLKPSPFCLLDEIEAALDDSNVVRYAKYLHKLTDHTQFIVITHRRGTMNAADRLYGITMQEKGISTLVSVNLIEEELEQTKKEE